MTTIDHDDALLPGPDFGQESRHESLTLQLPGNAPLQPCRECDQIRLLVRGLSKGSKNNSRCFHRG